MYYYRVWVRSSRYHGQESLTYSHVRRLRSGAIIEFELQKEVVMGLVMGTTPKPRFSTKPIHRVFDLPEIPGHLLKLGLWLQAYYPAPVGIITQQLLPAHLSQKQLDQKSPGPATSTPKAKLPTLTSDQRTAIEAMEQQNSYILHGKTGTGKTRVYIELAKRAWEAGKSSIVLTPEISLTTQLAERFRESFGDQVVVLHSQQSPAERQHAWLHVLRATNPIVVVGPRSALFSPLSNPGLIVLDESHETAYKQEQAPQYLAGRVAGKLADLTKSSLVYGSATPSVSDYYLAKQKQRPIVELHALAQPNNHPETDVKIIDRKDIALFSRSSQLSQPLIQSIQTALANGEQTLLYLNRRGTARMVLCQNCGWQAVCPHCDIPLTYHADGHQLRCHSCDHRATSPTSCTVCQHTDIIYKSAGTKAIVDEAKRLFPGAKVARFDTDNLRADRFEHQFAAVRDGKVDILVGTQLLAKGLDLPKLSTLGIILADTSLYMPDFSAQERTYQLISQVLGRVGRGHIRGHAIIQTYNPDHPVLRQAIAADYPNFYRSELANRQKYNFPPYCHLLKISVRRARQNAAESLANQIKNDIQNSGARVTVEGPAPAFYERFQNKYQWQLVVKAADRSELLKTIDLLPANVSYDIDPMDLL